MDISEHDPMEWAARLAHDFRTPLRTLQILNERLKAATDPVERRKLIAFIGEGLNRLQQRSDRVLMELSVEQKPSQLETVSLQLALDRVLPLIEGVYGRDHTIIETDGGEIQFTADAFLFEAVLQNLLVNSIQAAYPSREDRPHRESLEIRLHLTIAEDQIKLVLADDGPGLPEEIWDTPFTGLVPSGGNGWGLQLVRKAVQRMNGTIESAASPEGGTLFTIVLPR